MTTARVTAVMLDGAKHEATGVYMALADRIAFERRYNMSILELRRQSRSLGADGEPQEISVADLQEERTAFFVWRVLQRAEVPCGEFDEFLEAVEELQLQLLEGPAEPRGDEVT